MSIESVMPSNNLIFYHLLILLPSIFPSMRVFSNELALHIRWPKHWSFSFSISPSNEYSGFISFGIDWFDLLAVQGTLKSPLQCYNLKASILWAFFVIQFSHPYMTIGKTIALTIQTFMSKVMSLLLNMSLMSTFVIAFLPMRKCLLISWLQSWKDFGCPRKFLGRGRQRFDESLESVSSTFSQIIHFSSSPFWLS